MITFVLIAQFCAGNSMSTCTTLALPYSYVSKEACEIDLKNAKKMSTFYRGYCFQQGSKQ